MILKSYSFIKLYLTLMQYKVKNLKTNRHHPELDTLDFSILDLLLHQQKITYSEIAQQLSVSNGTVHGRIKKMYTLNVIQGSRLNLAYDDLGFGFKAFYGLQLEASIQYENVCKALEDTSEVLSLKSTTGPYHLMGEILCIDSSHLKDLLHKKLQKIEGVKNIDIFTQLDQRFDRAPQIMD